LCSHLKVVLSTTTVLAKGWEFQSSVTVFSKRDFYENVTRCDRSDELL
jgi:hypothetical protein